MSWLILLEDFRDFLLLERVYSARTIDTYLKNLSRFQRFCESRNLASPVDVVLDELVAFVNILSHLKTSTQAQYVATLKTFFKYLISAEHLTMSPAEFLESPKKEQTLPKYLTIKEISDIIKQTDDVKQPLRAKAVILTIYCCGLRVNELVLLDINDVMNDIELIRVTGKGNKERIIPISVHAIHAIEQYKAKERTKPCIEFENRLFTTSTGKAMRHIYVWTLFKNLCDLANIQKDVSPHSLRHSFATHLKQNGASLLNLQRLLGHERLSDTQRYARLELTQLREAVMKHPANKVEDGE